MWIGENGRAIVWCAGALLAGNAIGGATPLSEAARMILASSTAIVPILHIVAARRQMLIAQWIAILLSFFLLGWWALLIGRSQAERTPSAIEQYAQRTRTDISYQLGKYLAANGAGDDEIAVLRALTTGDKSALSRDVKRNFRASGATHLLALSGLHVGIIYKLFGYLFAIFGGAPRIKRLRSLLTMAFLWWFAVVTGLSPSIFRAVLMISIYETGILFGRRGNGLNSLAVSAMIITLLNPEAPRDLSFQMSFCACLSIFTIYPKLHSLMVTELKLLEYVWNCACLAISCQMTTGLIAWFKFGTFPKYFIICNLLTVPLVALIMYLAATTIVTASVADSIPQLGKIVVQALIEATKLLNSITEIIAEI